MQVPTTVCLLENVMYACNQSEKAVSLSNFGRKHVRCMVSLLGISSNRGGSKFLHELLKSSHLLVCSCLDGVHQVRELGYGGDIDVTSEVAEQSG